MTAVVAFLLGIVFLLGGLIPNFAVGILEQNISTLLNNPQKVEVNLASTPSFALLGGQIDRATINVQRFTVSGMMIDKLEITTGPIKLNGDKLIFEGMPVAENKIQLEIKCSLKEDDINDYFKSKYFTEHLQKLKQNMPSFVSGAGDIEIKDISIKLKNDKPEFKGEIKTMGGFFTLPFYFGAYLRLTSEDTLALLEPEIIVMDNPIPDPMLRQVTDTLNPLIDLRLLNTPNFTFHFRSIEAKEGSLILTGDIEVKNIPTN